MNIYRCEECKYTTDKKCNYEKHILSRKHIDKQPKSSMKDIYMCKDCGVVCSYRQSYERHIKKNCKMRQPTLKELTNENNELKNEVNMLKNLIKELFKDKKTEEKETLEEK